MTINEVDFTSIISYKDTEVNPVFAIYKDECFEFHPNDKSSWHAFQKIFFNKIYLDNHEYIDSILERDYLRSANGGIVVFSKYSRTFGIEKLGKEKNACKFAKNRFVRTFSKSFSYLILLSRILKETNFSGFKLYVAKTNEIDTSDFKKDLKKFEKSFRNKKKITLKQANLVVSHINGLILTDKEKLFKRIRKEYDSKVLIGDIVINEDEEKIIKDYLRCELQSNGQSFSNVEYPKVFAFAAVRYAMENYNRKGNGEFFQYFKEYCGYPLINLAGFHKCFKEIMRKTGKAYSDKTTNKIDNITMHSFVANNCANHLFDFLFSFWRLDLGRNAATLNDTEEGQEAFRTLIILLNDTNQSVRSHTALLASFPDKNIQRIFKNRVKRILKIMDDCFWNGKAVNETGNRINHLLNIWMNNPKSPFIKEKKFVERHLLLKNKNEILYRAPIFKLDSKNERLKMILPMCRLVTCDKDDRPLWTVQSDSLDFPIELSPSYEHDNIGYYIDKKEIELPISSILSGFTIILSSNGKKLKEYNIAPSKIRFFDTNGGYIDHETRIFPEGDITSYSDSKEYPRILGGRCETYKDDSLYIKYMSVLKGEIVILDGNRGIQVGQKKNIDEGYGEHYPLEGCKLISDSIEYQIYSKLPKLIFKATPNELDGISLTINGSPNKISAKVNEFRIEEDLKNIGYVLDLNDFIKTNGLYEVYLSYPRYHKNTNHIHMVYLRNFSYEFIDAPYVFQESCEISFNINARFKEESIEQDNWQRGFDCNKYFFNFAERNEERDAFCKYVSNQELVLTYLLKEKECKIHFEIPALHWKYSEDEEWNVSEPSNITLKELKSSKRKLFVHGPFDFSKSSLFTNEDVEIAEEESKIGCVTNSKKSYFELDRVFNWFKDDKEKVFRNVDIDLGVGTHHLLSVVCKSDLKDANLIGDFDNNILRGEIDIVGNEEYTATIVHNGLTLCEDLPIIDGKFDFEVELENGIYELYIYESSEDDDGFDIETSSILLGKRSVKLIDLRHLRDEKIEINGYRNKNEIFSPVYLNGEHRYVLEGFKKTSPSEIETDDGFEILGIWGEEEPFFDEKSVWYKSNIYRYAKDGTSMLFMHALVIFTDTNDKDSILVLERNDDGECYDSLTLFPRYKQIMNCKQCEKATKETKRQLTMLFDDTYRLRTTIKEK